MYRTARMIRTAAVVAGCGMIIAGVANYGLSFTLDFNLENGRFITTFAYLINRLAGAFSTGALLIVAAALMSPEKAAPLLRKRVPAIEEAETEIEEETADIES